MKNFKVQGLGGIEHNKETLIIMENLDNQIWPTWSQFIRESIVAYAKNTDFNWSINNHKPDFINDNQWQEYQELTKQKKKRKRKVDYTYLIIFRWLQNVRFRGISTAWLMREIITSSPLLDKRS